MLPSTFDKKACVAIFRSWCQITLDKLIRNERFWARLSIGGVVAIQDM